METSSWLELEGVSEPLHLYSHRVTESTEEFPRPVSHRPVASFRRMFHSALRLRWGRLALGAALRLARTFFSDA